jgi:hypothetical protein
VTKALIGRDCHEALTAYLTILLNREPDLYDARARPRSKLAGAGRRQIVVDDPLGR